MTRPTYKSFDNNGSDDGDDDDDYGDDDDDDDDANWRQVFLGTVLLDRDRALPRTIQNTLYRIHFTRYTLSG